MPFDKRYYISVKEELLYNILEQGMHPGMYINKYGEIINEGDYETAQAIKEVCFDWANTKDLKDNEREN